MPPFPFRIRQFAALSGCLTRIWALAGSLVWPLAAQDFQPAYDLAKIPGTSLDAPALLAHGKLPGDGFGRVIRTGDVNGDGFEDLIVGSATASAGPQRIHAGTVCIWLGNGQIGGVFDAASSVGRAPDVTLLGARPGDSLTSGGALTVADVNGDGITDLLLGAPGADGPAASRDGAGESYIVFGRDIFPNVLDLAVQGDRGADVTIHGASAGDSLTSGGALTAGDVNGDGITDILLGALTADGPDESRPSAGEAYVIFGKEEFPMTLDLGIQGPGGADVTLYGAVKARTA